MREVMSVQVIYVNGNQQKPVARSPLQDSSNCRFNQELLQAVIDMLQVGVVFLRRRDCPAQAVVDITGPPAGAVCPWAAVADSTKNTVRAETAKGGGVEALGWAAHIWDQSTAAMGAPGLAEPDKLRLEARCRFATAWPEEEEAWVGNIQTRPRERRGGTK